MTKIAIISQPEQGVLIDVAGCATMQEATQHLTYTLQVSSQFLEEQHVDLNLGKLTLTREELGQVLSTLSEVGVRPRKVFASSATTKSALRSFNIVPAAGKPASLQQTAEETNFDPEQSGPMVESVATVAEEAVMQPVERDTIPVEVELVVDATTSGAESVVAATPCVADSAPNTDSDSPSSVTVATDAADQPTGETPTVTVAQPAEQEKKPNTPHVLYIKQNLRSGQAISHRGHLVIVGDVNPGAEVIAEGDITIWGALRGIAHAGVGGNVSAEIRALRFDPIQLRIAHAIARSPDRPKGGQRFNGPETARIVNGTIRISSSTPE